MEGSKNKAEDELFEAWAVRALLVQTGPIVRLFVFSWKSLLCAWPRPGRAGEAVTTAGLIWSSTQREDPDAGSLFFPRSKTRRSQDRFSFARVSVCGLSLVIGLLFSFAFRLEIGLL